MTVLNIYDEILLTRIENSPSLLEVGAVVNVVPRSSLLLGTSLNGRGFATMLAKRSQARGAVEFIEWLQQNCSDSERTTAAAALLLRDEDGSNALEYAMSAHKSLLVQAFLELVLSSASPATSELLLQKSLQEFSVLEIAVASYTPQLVAALSGKQLRAYAHSAAPQITRYSAALLDADRSRVCLKGAPVDQVAKPFWDEVAKEGAKEASDAVDVICGVPLLPGLTRSDSSAFETIVKDGDLSLIASEPMRTAIAFKWSAYGRKHWYWQVGWYAGYVISFLGGVGSLLLGSSPSSSEPFNMTASGDDNSSGGQSLGVLLFAATSLINLGYAREDIAEIQSLWKYLSSPTNLIDGSLHGLVLGLAPMLLVSSELASPVAAVATVLLFLKGQKVCVSPPPPPPTHPPNTTCGSCATHASPSQVLRGNEGMSFLVNMLYEITIDMRAFLLIQFGAVVSNAFAYRLLRGDTDAYGTSGASLFSSYALLMHADGVGEHDVYMDGCVGPALPVCPNPLFDAHRNARGACAACSPLCSSF